MKRTLKIKNDKFYKVIEEKNKVLKEAREVKEKWDALQEELQKHGLELNKFKEKLIPLGEEVKANPEYAFTEFEEIETAEAIDGEVEIVIYDAVEEYKDALRLRKYEELKKKEEEELSK